MDGGALLIHGFSLAPCYTLGSKVCTGRLREKHRESGKRRSVLLRPNVLVKYRWLTLGIDADDPVAVGGLSLI